MNRHIRPGYHPERSLLLPPSNAYSSSVTRDGRPKLNMLLRSPFPFLSRSVLFYIRVLTTALATLGTVGLSAFWFSGPEKQQITLSVVLEAAAVAFLMLMQWILLYLASKASAPTNPYRDTRASNPPMFLYLNTIWLVLVMSYRILYKKLDPTMRRHEPLIIAMTIILLEILVMNRIVGSRKLWLGGLSLLAMFALVNGVWQYGNVQDALKHFKTLAWGGVGIWTVLWVVHGVKALAMGAAEDEF